ncbi:Glutamate receptor 3.6 [Morella rubra]|uniref:Glutamate receptor 3.6 n=1 Tax=Morella rubra TaxID=262757 RepID=A0A6A1UPP6_9ROSI|nr:Glutamate receptor 3.6 [Morella rubra]
MENDTVAIIGPQHSVMAHVISHIANEIQVPLLSFAATDPSLNSLQFPYFVRTTQSDLFQMAAVADIVSYYEWQAVIAIYPDDDHGRNGIAALGDKLADKRCKISYKAPLSPKLNRESITNSLVNVALMDSRVIILHLYADWGLENPPSLQGMDSIQGVLTLRMHTPDSELKRNFVSRWSNLTATRTDNDPFGLNAYGLYAYDTVSLLAHALHDAFLSQTENISFSNNPSLSEFHGGTLHLDALSIFDGGKVLLDSVLQVNISGVTGSIKFNSDGNLIHPAYEVINIIGKGMRIIGYWSNSSGLSVLPPEKLQTTQKPRGWVFSSHGRQLRVGVPILVSFREFVKRVGGSDIFHGYCIDIFNAAVELLPYALPYKFVPYGDGHSNPVKTDLLHMITTGEFDAVVGDITITTNRTKMVDFTQPYIESGLVVVAPVKKLNSSAWAFLRPFTPMMWGVTGQMTNLEAILENNLVTIVWFSFSTLVPSPRENVNSTLGRFVLNIWLFVVLVLTSSYTASLTSILTVEKLSSPIKGIESLMANNDPIGYQHGTFIDTYLTKSSTSKVQTCSLNSEEEYEKALKDGPQKGGVSAIVDMHANMELFLSTRCDFSIVGQEFTKMGWGFAFPRDSPLAIDMSIAILKLSENGELQKIHDKWLARKACMSEAAKEEVDRLPLKSFALSNMWLGYFLSLLYALLFYVIKMVRQYMRLPARSQSGSVQSFLSFVKEKEDDVHEEKEGEGQCRVRRR